VPPGLGTGFDDVLGLKILDLTPEGGRVQLIIKDELLQPWGIVHGGVYCSIIESLASVSANAWLNAEGGGGRVVGGAVGATVAGAACVVGTTGPPPGGAVGGAAV